MTKIYQAYYDNSQIFSMDPSFIPYDNRANKRPDLREYPLLKDLFWRNRKENFHWGLVSTKWKEKTFLDGTEFKLWIDDNPGYDVYFIDPYLEVSAVCNNLWTQDRLTDFANMLFPKIGINKRCEDVYYAGEDFCTCNYFVGNSRFWTEWFLYVDNILVMCSQDKNMYNYLYNKGREYSYTKDGKESKSWIPEFIFILERLTSLFFIQNRNIRKLKFPSNHECYTRQFGEEKHKMLLTIYNMKKEGNI